MEGDAKVALPSPDGLNGSIGVKLNIDMPADLDQFGRDNSHGTVIGGEGLVQLGHDPADSRVLLHQVDLVT